MKVLGVDPGIKHTGYAVLDDGKIIETGTIIPPDDLDLTVHAVLGYVLPRLSAVVLRHAPVAAGVEQVAWYGSRKKITLPLSHIAGGIAGMLWEQGVETYLLIASMKTAKVKEKKTWDEHQKDAAVLAKVIWDYLSAEVAADRSYLRKHSAVGRRKITVRPSVQHLPYPGD